MRSPSSCSSFFFFNDTATTEIYTLSLHDALPIPRVTDRAVAGVLVRGPHGELVHVGLAEDAAARLRQLANRHGRVRRAIALEDPRARSGLDPLGAEDVLHGDRRASQRPIRSPIRRSRLGAPQVGAELVAGSRLRVDVEVLVTVQLPGGDPLQGLRCRELEDVAHACGEGTRNAPSSGSGAGSRTRSRGQLGRGSSARSTFSSATTCEVGSTPSRSSSFIRSTWSRIPDSSPAIRSSSGSVSSRRASRATWRTWSRSIMR